MKLLLISIAPIIIILGYIYFRDKYEREPIGLLLKGLLVGMFIIIPILIVEFLLMIPADYMSGWGQAAYVSFVVAASTEELFKFLAVFMLIWWNKNFNEKFDGIVYAVFVSLGFALVENIMYVFEYGGETGFARAITSVPAHTFFGVFMGFYLGIAKFFPDKKKVAIRMAIFIPILFHGIYDFLLLSENTVMLILFFPFMALMWWLGFKRMRQHISTSRFRDDGGEDKEMKIAED